ncbi:MAG: anthranilate synthase component I family protein [Tepidisphaeraceae bacterium]|jgi:para-aminobenzoate synthetase component 1
MHLSPAILLDSSRPAPGLWCSPQSGARMVLRCEGSPPLTTLYGAGEPTRTWDDPLEALRWMSDHIRSAPPGGRWIGFLSYDLGRFFEELPATAADELQLPLFVFTFHDAVARRSDTGPAQPGRPWLGDQNPEGQAASGGPGYALPGRTASPMWHIPAASNFTRAQYESAVAVAAEYIAAGDIFQVNLSQRFRLGLRHRPLEVYRRLLERTPADYGAMLDYGDLALVCNSPELFLHVAPDRRVVTRPVKGTRPRQPGMALELRDSVKDQAELNMIVDLERNDLGRVCEIGSVRVTQRRVIESHPTVYHGVATIEGILRTDVGFVDLLRATFPGGSITGTPKIRAMQIIEELERTRRGPYCGAIGLLAADGTIELNVAIRTIVIKDGLAYVAVGGGVVADSVPAEEYEETLVKARAMLDALTPPTARAT